VTGRLAGQLAVVTGAGSGIGRAVAAALAAEGASLCLVGRTARTLDETARSLHAGAPRVLVSATDLTQDDQVEALRVRLGAEFGRVDVFVHAAGEIAHGALESQPVGDFDRQYRANVRAAYVLLQALLPLLRTAPGQVVVIGSSTAFRAPAGTGQFAATQHALKALTDALRDEVNASGVRVLGVFPGRTATPRQAALHARHGNAYRPELLLQPEDVAAMVVAALALPRTAEVTEIHLRPLLKSY